MILFQYAAGFGSGYLSHSFGSQEMNTVFSLAQLEANFTRRPSAAPTKSPSNIPTSQYSALHTFYIALNGSGWTYQYSRDGFRPWEFKNPNANPCAEDWSGVDCNCTFIECNVTTIDLTLHNLVGKIPPAIQELVGLQHLKLSNNTIYGTLPPEICNLKNLQSLYISFNRLTGPIPHDIGNLSKLKQLGLYWNHLNGSIPKSTYNLNELMLLQLQQNQLSGSILSSIGKLSNLTVLFLSANKFNGKIPGAISNLTNLQQLGLGLNEFTGSIPNGLNMLVGLKSIGFYNNSFTGHFPNVQNLGRLSFVRIQGNLFSGPFPVSFTYLKKLKVLYLGGNSFTGHIPTNISGLNELYDFYVAQNFFSGTVKNTFRMIVLSGLALSMNQFTGLLPTSYWQFLISYTCYTNYFSSNIPVLLSNNTLLYQFDVSSNLLSGTFPNWIVGLKTLQQFYLFDNLLSGTLPEKINNLVALAEFRAGKNFLSGTIPSNIAKLPLLVQLDLQDNFLTGSIPPNILKNPYLQILFLHNNELSGTFPLVTNGSVIFSLTNIDVSNNQITGTLPSTEFSALPMLSSLAVVSNCFHGTIPPSLCTATSLTALSLDGMATGTACRVPIFPDIFSDTLNAFLLKSYFTSGIPSCLFSMPNLQSLHLSGNGLDGGLPNNLTISNSLVDLSLSHNLLTGNIPDSIQSKSNWQNLDLSYNKFSGKLKSDLFQSYYGKNDSSSLSSMYFPTMESSAINNFQSEWESIISRPMYIRDQVTVPLEERQLLVELSEDEARLLPKMPKYSEDEKKNLVYIRSLNQNKDVVSWATRRRMSTELTANVTNSIYETVPSLTLNVNRLSGPIPESVLPLLNISILDGNLFQCNMQRSELPENDPKVTTYSCGSDIVDGSLIIWFVIMCIPLSWFCLYLYTVSFQSQKQNITPEKSDAEADVSVKAGTESKIENEKEIVEKIDEEVETNTDLKNRISLKIDDDGWTIHDGIARSTTANVVLLDLAVEFNTIDEQNNILAQEGSSKLREKLKSSTLWEKSVHLISRIERYRSTLLELRFLPVPSADLINSATLPAATNNLSSSGDGSIRGSVSFLHYNQSAGGVGGYASRYSLAANSNLMTRLSNGSIASVATLEDEELGGTTPTQGGFSLAGKGNGAAEFPGIRQSTSSQGSNNRFSSWGGGASSRDSTNSVSATMRFTNMSSSLANSRLQISKRLMGTSTLPMLLHATTTITAADVANGNHPLLMSLPGSNSAPQNETSSNSLSHNISETTKNEEESSKSRSASTASGSIASQYHYTSNIYFFVYFTAIIRKIFMVLTAVIFMVYLPVYVVVSLYERTYYEQYIWTISPLIVSGIIVGSVLCAMFGVFVIASIILLEFLIIQMYELWTKFRVNNYAHYTVTQAGEDSNNNANHGIGSVRSSMMGRPSMRYNDRKSMMQPPSRVSTFTTGSDSSEPTVPERRYGPISSYFIRFYNYIDRFDLIVGMGIALINIINFFVMILADVAYVLTYLNSNILVVIVAQILLAIFKLFWNDFILWRSFPIIKKYAYLWTINNSETISATSAGGNVGAVRYPGSISGDIMLPSITSTGTTTYSTGSLPTVISSAKMKNETAQTISRPVSINTAILSSVAVASQENNTEARKTKGDDGGNANDTDHIPIMSTGAYLPTTSETINLIVLNILNNIIIPAVAIVLVSPNCFYNALFKASAVTSHYDFYTCINFVVFFRYGYTCLRSTVDQEDTSYDPPFIYRYQCSSYLIMNYIPVYIFMFIIVGMVIPVCKLVIKSLHTHYRMVLAKLKQEQRQQQNAEISNNVNKQMLKFPQNWIYFFIDALLPYNLRPLSTIAHTTPKKKKGKDSSPSEPFSPIAATQYPLFEKHRFIVRITSHLAIFLSYGVIFPPLAAIICLATMINTFYEEYVIGRLVTKAFALQYDHILAQLEVECDELAASFSLTSWGIMRLSTLLFAFIVFDCIGDIIGWELALLPTLMLLVLPGLVMFLMRVNRRSSRDIIVVLESDETNRNSHDSFRSSNSSDVYRSSNMSSNSNQSEENNQVNRGWWWFGNNSTATNEQKNNVLARSSSSSTRSSRWFGISLSAWPGNSSAPRQSDDHRSESLANDPAKSLDEVVSNPMISSASTNNIGKT